MDSYQFSLLGYFVEALFIVGKDAGRLIALRLLAAVLLLLIIPALAGSLFRRNVDKDMRGLIFQWISGQLCLWAGFQLICVPVILLELDFEFVVAGYSAVLVLTALTAIGLAVRNRKAASAVTVIRGFDRKRLARCIPWMIFWGILIFQLVQVVRMTYRDGDDAYYVAISSITQDARTMYRKLPYTGYTTELDARHGLAPFPIWIAYLAEVMGIRAVSAAHVAVPIVLITMTYGIYYLLGEVLLREKRDTLPLFMIFTELLVLFGDYSFYTVENFMIARSRQGKAALGSIVIPAILLLLLVLLQRLQEGEKVSLKYYVLLAAAGMTGCLCSTMGAMLCCMLVGIVGLCAAAAYKRWKILVPLALCCLPAVCYAVLYLVLD